MPSRRLRRARSVAVLACLAGAVPAVAVTSTAAAAGPVASAAATCSAPKYPGVGYFTSLKATKVSCKSANTVLKHHYSCRLKKGRSGKCTKKVDGYKCTEGKRQSSSVEFNARVTCTKSGGKKIVFTYQQDIS